MPELSMQELYLQTHKWCYLYDELFALKRSPLGRKPVPYKLH